MTANFAELLQSLQDPQQNGDVDRRAVEQLATLGGKQAVEPLISVLEYGPTCSAHHAAASVLGKRSCKRSIEPLCRALNNENGDVRRVAALALAETSDVGAVKPLSQILANDKDKSVRKAAFLALGLILTDLDATSD